jgi:uncharacterized protein YidB (DUF937 family)
MINQLIESAQEYLAPQLQQAGVDQSQLGGIFDTAKDSITGGLKDHATNGNMDSILSLFNGQGGSIGSNPVVSSLSQNFLQSLVEKTGMDQAMATKVSSAIVPFIMQKFSSAETGNASSITDLITKLGFGNGDNISSSLDNLLDGKEKGSDLLSGLGKLF